MQPIVEAIIAFALMLAGAGAGIFLRHKLPQHHLNDHTRDVVRLSSALVATLAALVLGLLISSASASFEAQRGDIRQLAADVILLDTLLADFGPEARPTRQLLRDITADLVDQVWSGRDMMPGISPVGLRGTRLFEAIQTMPTATPLQRTIQDQSMATMIRLSQARLMLYERSHSRLPQPILYVLLFWLTALFASFSLFVPLNPTSGTALMLVALSAAAALFLILDMGRPFTGFMQISPHALDSALPPLPS